MVKKPQTKVGMVAAGLRRAVLSGELQRGQRLYETEIATRFSVTRTPVREAFRILNAEGLVTLRDHRGAVVTHLSADGIQEKFEIRAVLEGMAGRYAVDNISSGELTQLRELVDKMRFSVNSPPEFLRLNAEFHSIMNKASKKQYLLEMLKNLRLGTQYYLWHVVLTSTLMRRWQRQHESILRAFERSNGYKVELLLRDHVLDAAKALADYFKQVSQV